VAAVVRSSHQMAQHLDELTTLTMMMLIMI